MESETTLMAEEENTSIPPAPVFLTTEELAKRWRRSPRTIKRARAIGRLPATAFGPRDFRFDLKVILEIERNGSYIEHLTLPPENSEKPARKKAPKKK
jgi:hypothetical protein